MGDTGQHYDPNEHAQNLELLLGKGLRIDVNHAGAGQAFAEATRKGWFHSAKTRLAIFTRSDTKG